MDLLQNLTIIVLAVASIINSNHIWRVAQRNTPTPQEGERNEK